MCSHIEHILTYIQRGQTEKKNDSLCPTNEQKSPTDEQKRPTNEQKSPTDEQKRPTNEQKRPTNDIYTARSNGKEERQFVHAQDVAGMRTHSI